jgi:hypothetical protein
MSDAGACRDSPREWTQGWRLACFATFGITLLVASWPTLDQEFAWDSLHLLRNFSSEELLSAWTGPWDSDAIERRAYRPLVPAFYSILYGMFGEAPLHYRLFLILVMSSALLLLVEAGRHYVRRWEVPALGILLFLLSNVTSVYVGWLTEAFRSLQLFWFASCFALLHYGLTRKSIALVLLSVIAHALGLLTREENLPLTIFPIAVAVRCVSQGWSWGEAAPSRRRIALGISSLFLLQIPVYMILRRIFVPDPTGRLDPFGPFELLLATLYSFPFAGLPVIAIVVGFINARRLDSRSIVFLLTMVAASCVPGLGKVRIDVCLYPTLFLSLAAASALEPLFLSSRVLTRAGAVGVIAVMSVLGVCGSWVRASQLDDLSVQKIRWNLQMLYGKYADRATIPVERRERLSTRYRELGLEDDHLAWIAAIKAEARQASRFSKDDSGRPFLARTDFLSTESLAPALLKNSQSGRGRH